MDLETFRKEIDGIDDQLWRLIVRRIELSRRIAQCKLEQNRPVSNPAREREIVARLRAMTPEPYRDSVCAVYRRILKESKTFQQKWIDGRTEAGDR